MERFSHFVLTDEKGAESLDRAPVVKGEIRLADRGYAHPEAIAKVIKAGGDLVVRAGGKSMTWLNSDGDRMDLIAALREAEPRLSLDRAIFVKRKNGQSLAVRFVAVTKSPEAAEKARRQARRAAHKRNDKRGLLGAVHRAGRRSRCGKSPNCLRSRRATSPVLS
jgi:hypothetical protein